MTILKFDRYLFDHRLLIACKTNNVSKGLRAIEMGASVNATDRCVDVLLCVPVCGCVCDVGV